MRKQCMLDRYWQRRHLDARQYHAGRRFYRQWKAAGGNPRVPRDVDSGDEISIKFRQAALAMGRQLDAVVIHVCLTDAPAADWAADKMLPKSDGIARLRAGLDALADHYGMPGG